jgi:mycothiol S-conjugate amidase
VTDRCLLTVHAHPDDEASKGAGTVRRYADDGIRCVLVCATGGEAGDILNAALDSDDVRSRIGEVRRQELDRSAGIIGYEEVIMLGYRDSGMPDSEPNAHPDAFVNQPFDDCVDRLVEIVRSSQPQVMVTYDDVHEGYPHPDHIRVQQISDAAYDKAADVGHRPDLGEPWAISKLYRTMFSRDRLEKMHIRLNELGLESPFDAAWFERPWQDHRITTRVEVSGQYSTRKAALLAHATQVAPDSPFWFGLPDHELAAIHPWDDYSLAAHRLGDYVAGTPDEPETDLFAGIA